MTVDRDYESVDEKSQPILGYVPKNVKKNSGSKGLNHLMITFHIGI